MVARRKQKPVQFRSDYVSEQLRLRTQDGRSQAAVIEEALRLLPPIEDDAEMAIRREQLRDAIKQMQDAPQLAMTNAEFDAFEYDEFGLPR